MSLTNLDHEKLEFEAGDFLFLDGDDLADAMGGIDHIFMRLEQLPLRSRGLGRLVRRGDKFLARLCFRQVRLGGIDARGRPRAWPACDGQRRLGVQRLRSDLRGKRLA